MIKPLLFYIAIFLLCPSFFGQNESTIIQKINTHVDHVENGAKGILITYEISIKEIKVNYASDSLQEIALNQIEFKIKMTPRTKDQRIIPGYGYESLKDKNGYLELNITQSLNMVEKRNGIKKCFTFIPYASMSLASGKQELKWSIDVKSKDGSNKLYEQHIDDAPFTFNQPTINYFTLNLDSIRVNPYDSHGQSWDQSMYGSEAPDLDFSIFIGHTKVGNIHKGNSYFISFPHQPRKFKFAVAENDEVYIYLKDSDDVIDDDIASWKFDLSNMKKGVNYQQTIRKANLKSFHFVCTLD